MALNEATNQRQYLKDYSSPVFAVNSIQLAFDIHDQHTIVRNEMQLSRLKSGDLILDGSSMELVSIHLDGRRLEQSEYSLTDETLKLHRASDKLHLVIETKIFPDKNTSLEGLYVSSNCLVTQCEAQGFRKITYFFDRPDVMTSYQVSIEADKKKYPILLSNGDRISLTEKPDGRHVAKWSDPHKKPSYLFALFAGEMGLIKDSFTTKSGRKVNLEVYAAHGKQDKCHHAMASLKKSMKWDEESFGLEYDLNDYMIVAIDDFNSGAMENKGLNIFNSRLVLADEKSATDADYHNIESVVAHEYFHNWTGNRVTLRDWFQLSLKEGLTVYRDQEFSSDIGDRSVQRIANVDHLRSSQFAEDAGPNAHPVRPDSCLAVDNFFTMTIYEKGAEVIRMMQNIVGKKAFRKGMDTYFARHDGQAVTCDDFSSAILLSNGIDDKLFKNWYTQAGTPVVQVSETFDLANKTYTINLKQSCRETKETATKQPFFIPLIFSLYNSAGEVLQLESDQIRKNSDGKNLLDLKEFEQSFTFKNVSAKPILSILQEFSAPVRLDWKQNQSELLFLAKHDLDGFNRRESVQKLLNLEFSHLMSQHHTAENAQVNPELVSLFGSIIKDTKIDNSFKAMMMSLPDDSQIIQEQAILNAESLLFARNQIIKAIGLAHKSSLHEAYLSLHKASLTGLGHKEAGMRLLKNKYLEFLIAADKAFEDLAFEQFKSAKNMTDKMAAMTVLSHYDSKHAAAALSSFEQEWKEDKLVMNKWLAVQALSPSQATLKVVKSLLDNPNFNIKNPNNVYSLLRAFGRNLTSFYRKDGTAIEFYADQILKIDAFNPQVAARICEAFNFVSKLEPSLKALAKKEVARVLSEPSLSKNTKELLEPILTMN